MDYIKINQPMQSLEAYLSFLENCQTIINDFLNYLAKNYLHLADKIFLAAKYVLLNKGKRIRPALVYAIGNLFELDLHKLNAAAASIELLHCYSLVHDDLPAMDDDDLRRGQPSCHKAFNEATAILVGDGLQALAFEVLACQKLNPFSAIVRSEMVVKLAKYAGLNGMVYGQAKDLDSENKIIDLEDLEKIHFYKTGSLINCCIELAILANSNDKFIKHQLLEYGKHLGLVFQIKDDILDVEQSTLVLGKSSKTDQKLNKATFVSILGMDRAKLELQRHADLACTALYSLIKNVNLNFNKKNIDLLYNFIEYFKNRNK